MPRYSGKCVAFVTFALRARVRVSLKFPFIQLYYTYKTIKVKKKHTKKNATYKQLKNIQVHGMCVRVYTYMGECLYVCVCLLVGIGIGG